MADKTHTSNFLLHTCRFALSGNSTVAIADGAQITINCGNAVFDNRDTFFSLGSGSRLAFDHCLLKMYPKLAAAEAAPRAPGVVFIWNSYIRLEEECAVRPQGQFLVASHTP